MVPEAQTQGDGTPLCSLLEYLIVGVGPTALISVLPGPVRVGCWDRGSAPFPGFPQRHPATTTKDTVEADTRGPV